MNIIIADEDLVIPSSLSLTRLIFCSVVCPIFILGWLAVVYKTKMKIELFAMLLLDSFLL